MAGIPKQLKYHRPRHYCWWCKGLFEEGDITHYKSGWLCDKCHDYLKTQTGDEE